jgi:hypothetical protein
MSYVSVLASPRSPVKNRGLKTLTIAAIGCVLLILAILQIYYRIYSGFAIYDSEGATLINARNLFQGYRLYDQIYSLYGPFYYMVQWMVHAVTASPETLDQQRLISGIYWLLAECLFSWLTYRLTKSPLAAGLSLLVMAHVFPYMAQEPGHPQEFCTAAIAGILIAATYVDGRRHREALAIIAALVASLFTSKINEGVFIFLAVGIALASATQRPILRIGAFGSLSVAALIVPTAIMWPLLDTSWAIAYCIFSTCAIGISILVAYSVNRSAFIKLGDWVVYAITLTLFASLPLIFFSARGTSLLAALNMTLLQQKGFAIAWNSPLTASPTAPQLALAFVPVAWMYIYSKRLRDNPNAFHTAISLLKFVAGALILFFLYRNNFTILLKISPAYLWMLAAPPSGTQNRKTMFARCLLCLISALHILYAFPCAGSQVKVAAVPLLLVGVVLLTDSLEWAAERYLTAPRLRMAATAAGVIGIVSLSAWQTLEWRKDYQSLTPLNLPGSTKIRTNAADVETYQFLVSSINSRCSTFYTMPGLFSFHLWTQKFPPTTFNADAWMLVMSPDQQRRVVKELSQASGMCIVYCPRLVDFWLRGHKLGASPLADYALNRFSVAFEKNGYFLMVPKP